MAKEPKDLVKPTGAAVLMASRPQFLKSPEEVAPRGLEEATMQDMILPRVAICQTMSEERKRTSPKYIEGLVEGQLFNSLTKEIYGESIMFTPLFFYKSRIKFRPQELGGGIECMNPTGKSCALNNGGPCLHSAWGQNGEKPECDEFFNFPALIHLENGRQDFAILSFKRTAINAGKDLNSKIRSRRADAFAGMYRMGSFLDKNNLGEFYVPLIENAGWVDEQTYRAAEDAYTAFYESVLSGAVTMDTSGLANEAEREQNAPF